MKKLSCLLVSSFALAALILSGCPQNPAATSEEVSQEQIEKNIVGTWLMSERDGEALVTNHKMVIEITSITKAYISSSGEEITRPEKAPDGSAPTPPEGSNPPPEGSNPPAEGSNPPPEGDFHVAPFFSRSEATVEISGNLVTITNQEEGGRNHVQIFIVKEISENKLTVLETKEGTFTYIKVKDYSKDILGLWEGKCTSEGSVFDDGKEHRWQYNQDGSYVYYNKVDDNWVKAIEENEYFVAGNLLCTRWVENETENREWWEITIDNGKMNWTALRTKEDKSTFTATFEMNKVTQ